MFIFIFIYYLFIFLFWKRGKGDDGNYMSYPIPGISSLSPHHIIFTMFSSLSSHLFLISFPYLYLPHHFDVIISSFSSVIFFSLFFHLVFINFAFFSLSLSLIFLLFLSLAYLVSVSSSPHHLVFISFLSFLLSRFSFLHLFRLHSFYSFLFVTFSRLLFILCPVSPVCLHSPYIYLTPLRIFLFPFFCFSISLSFHFARFSFPLSFLSSVFNNLSYIVFV